MSHLILISNSKEECVVDDQSNRNVECETVSLDDENKKFKIININQANLERGNKFEHKAQLIEIDKLLINTPSGPKPNGSSKIGVWHQVSL
jgi:hypothetical protein